MAQAAGLAHSIGHALGTIADIHHGRAVGIGARCNIPEKCRRLLSTSHAVISSALGVQSLHWSLLKFWLKWAHRPFSDFIRRTGIEMSLKQDGLCEDDLERLVDVIRSSENTSDELTTTVIRPARKIIRKFTRQLLSR